MKRRNSHTRFGRDLETWTKVVGRREVLQWLAMAAGSIPIVGCGSETSAINGSGGTGGPKACPETPKEQAGPYPADGSNGPNALTNGVVRGDIRSSFGSMTGTAEGVPLTLRLTLLDAGGGCAPLAGYVVYVWQSDRAGEYSLYDLPNQNYLRGVQEADANGLVTFSSIFPACYFWKPIGRAFWPHIHLEVYPNLTSATDGGNAIMTSQLALPVNVCNQVYATPGYEQSATNLSQLSLGKNDLVFGDGYALQVPTVTGSVGAGYVATIDLGVTDA